jgi:FAD/FMN-containing dehydrogenase
MPAYVVLPRTSDEIAQLLRLFHDNGIRWVARGNGSSAMGLVMIEGAVPDLPRMQDLDFDEETWSVRVGPGISAFELQREAVRRDCRVNVAEPAALVCSNIIGTGIFSTFMAGHGTAADSFIDAGFVAPDGSRFALSEKHAPNLFAFRGMSR